MTLTLWSLTLAFDLLYENLTLVITFDWLVLRLSYFTCVLHVYSFWQDHSIDTTTLTLWSLTLEFDLLFKNFNLSHNFWSVGSGKTFHLIPWPASLKILMIKKKQCKSWNPWRGPDEARYVTRRYVTNCYIPFREWRRYVTIFFVVT
jgi:hypothetical protein